MQKQKNLKKKHYTLYLAGKYKGEKKNKEHKRNTQKEKNADLVGPATDLKLLKADLNT